MYLLFAQPPASGMEMTKEYLPNVFMHALRAPKPHIIFSLFVKYRKIKTVVSDEWRRVERGGNMMLSHDKQKAKKLQVDLYIYTDRLKESKKQEN